MDNNEEKEPTKKDLIAALVESGKINEGEKWDNLTMDQLDHLIGLPSATLTDEEQQKEKEKYIDSLGKKDDLFSEEIVKRRTSEQNLRQLKNTVKAKVDELVSLLK